MPLPMIVWAMMSCGLPLFAFFALLKALRKAAMSWPSTVCTSHSIALKRSGGVLALRLVRHRVERDVVRVVDQDEVVELLVAGELDRLHRDALLHAAVAGEADDVVVENRCAPGC